VRDAGRMARERGGRLVRSSEGWGRRLIMRRVSITGATRYVAVCKQT